MINGDSGRMIVPIRGKSGLAPALIRIRYPNRGSLVSNLSSLVWFGSQRFSRDVLRKAADRLWGSRPAMRRGQCEFFSIEEIDGEELIFIKFSL